MIIIDTTIWIDYLRGVATPHTDWHESRVGQERLGLTDLILCEVLQGVRQDGDFRAVRRELLTFAVFPTGGIELAITAARHYRLLRVEGYTIRRTIDCLIATFCLQHGHGLLHNDCDFDSFEQVFPLMVIHSLTRPFYFGGLLKKHVLSLVEGAASDVLNLRAHRLGALRAVRCSEGLTYRCASLALLAVCGLAGRPPAFARACFLNSPGFCFEVCVRGILLSRKFLIIQHPLSRRTPSHW